MQRDNFRLLYGIQPAPAAISLSEIEALAYSALSTIHSKIPAIGTPWYDRFAVYGRNQSLVLRSFQIRKRRYLDHLATLRDINRQEFSLAEIASTEPLMPDWFWMTEISAPELFPMSRNKFGEIILPNFGYLPSLRTQAK